MGFLTAALDEITRDVVGVRPQERGRGQAFADHRSQPTTFSVEATVSDTLANLVCSGFKLTIQGESDRARRMAEVAEDFSQSTLADMMALAFVTGDALVVPVWAGNGFRNVVVGGDDFVIATTTAGTPTAVAYLVDERVEAGGRATQLVQVMSLGEYESVGGATGTGCHYTLHVMRDGRPTRDRPADVPGWDGYDADWWVPNVDRLLLGRYRCPQRDKRHPNGAYGVPLCYGASQPIREIHYLLDQLHNEFELSEKAVVADKAMFARDRDGSLNLPRGRERLFMATRGGSVDGNNITQWAPTIQAQPYLDALEVQKREVERCVGVDSGIISTPNDNNYQNVDNVRKSTRNTQAFVNRARGVADQTMDDLLYAWDMLMNFHGLPTGDYSRDRDWSDEYIESFADKRDALVAGYSMGATDAYDYRLFVLGEAPEVASQRVAEIAASRRVTVLDE